MKPRIVIPLMLAASPLVAQEKPIQDNSFLMEEAYNQEKGVVQHISFFSHDLKSSFWTYNFTQEWPVGGQRNQLSYTVPFEHAGYTGGMGDVLLNYRYQLAGSGDTKIAVAPRLSVMLPTGNDQQGRGTGGVGVQFDLPLSWVLTPKLVTHTNAGFTLVPNAHNPAGNTARTLGFNLGQSLVALVSPRFNLMLEAVWTRDQDVTGKDVTVNSNSFLLSPGVRYAFNFPSGLQIVPGLAVPVGVGPSSGSTSLVLYLSFEHPFQHQN